MLTSHILCACYMYDLPERARGSYEAKHTLTIILSLGSVVESQCHKTKHAK